VGSNVYVDEGDSFGCEEYTGVIEAFGEDGRFKVRRAEGTFRWASHRPVDPT
jgi:hypothetical protein